MNALTIVSPGRLPVFGRVLDILVKEGYISDWIALSIRDRKEMAAFVEGAYRGKVFYAEKTYFLDRYAANDYLHGLPDQYRFFDFGRILADEKRPGLYFPDGIIDVANMIRTVETILQEQEIGILINDYPASAMDMTAYLLSKSLGLITIIINGFRTGDRLFFNYEPEKGLKEPITYYYRKYRKEGLPEEERQKALEYLAFFRKTRYKPDVYQFTIPQKRNLFRKLSIEKVASYGYDLVRSPESFARRVDRQLNYYRLRRQWHRIFTPLDERDRIIFFPIQFQPEASTYLKAPYHRNQYSIVENLCLCIPSGYTLYVKEHSRQLLDKPPSFYRDYLERFPNLRFVDLSVDSHELINRSKLVVVLSSTVGWEAFLYGVPVVQFGRAFFSEFKGIYRSRTYEELREQIAEIISCHRPNEEEILKAIAAVFAGTTPGYINDPYVDPKVLEPENIRSIANVAIQGMEFYPQWMAHNEQIIRDRRAPHE